LIPSAIEPLTGGTINGVSTANAWNTTASLSRLSADARIDTTQVYAQIRPAQLKQSVAFHEGKALEALTK